MNAPTFKGGIHPDAHKELTCHKPIQVMPVPDVLYLPLSMHWNRPCDPVVKPGDRVLCFEEELPLYESCAPLAYGQEADVNTLSAGLFAALRELDGEGCGTVYARCPVGGGVAYAVQNRLKKAAAFQVVDAEVEV